MELKNQNPIRLNRPIALQLQIAHDHAFG